MINKYRNKLKVLVKILIFTLVILNFLVPVLAAGFKSYRVSNDNDFYNGNNYPNIQGFSKDDYSPILSEEKQGLGFINITDFNFGGFDETGFFNNSIKYPDLFDDFNSTALNVSSDNLEFIRTSKTAQVDNLNDEVLDFNKITAILNETLNVQYNKSKKADIKGELIYGPRLYPCVLSQLYIKNESSSIVEVNDANYSIDEDNFLIFDYDNYFNGVEYANFSMYLIWEYNLTINNWALAQINAGDLIVTNPEENITATFEYYFYLEGKVFNGTNLQDISSIDELIIELKVSPPDKDLLENHTLKLNDIIISDKNLKNYLRSDNSFYFSLSANNNSFYINFTSDFTIKFIDPVDNTWAIDRLVDRRNIRERIYFPSIISGPEHIYLKNLIIHETTITFDQVESHSSLFERKFSYFDKNLTEFEEDIENSVVFTDNIVKKRGLEIKLPYMINGEISPFTLKYETIENLKIIITDNIHMPILGLEVEINYYGKRYGTYISNNRTQPNCPVVTNENGEILLTNVSNGNYIVKIYQNNELIMEAPVSSYREINYVITTIPHFPSWIIIFGSMNGIILVGGILFYLKNKKRGGN